MQTKPKLTEEGVVVTVAAQTTTAAVRNFLEYLLHSIAGDGTDPELEDLNQQVKGPNYFGLNSASIFSKLDIAVLPLSTDCDKALPLSCLCSVDDSDEVLTYFDDDSPSCNAGASVRWKWIISCSVSEVSGRSKAWTLNVSGKTLSLRRGFKIICDV